MPWMMPNANLCRGAGGLALAMKVLLHIVFVALFLPCGASAAMAAPAQRAHRGALITENIPQPSPQTMAAINRYADIRQYQFRGWLGTGALVSTRIGNTAQAFMLKHPRAFSRRRGFTRSSTVYLSAEGAAARPDDDGKPSPLRQLTHFTEPAREIVPSPDESHYIVSRDQGGDERFQGILFTSGQTHPVSFTEQDYRNSNFVFSRHGRWIAWQRSGKDSPDWDIMLAPVQNPVRGRRRVLKGDGTLLPLDFSPDNATLLVNRYLSVSESRLLLVDLASGAATPVNPMVAPVAYGRGVFTRNGKAIIVQSDEGRSFVGLLRIDLKSGKKRAMSPALKGDVTSFVLSADGRTLAYAVNIGGRSVVLVADAGTGQVLKAPKLPAGVVTNLAFDRRGHRLGFSFDGARHPQGVWVYTWRANMVREWTKDSPGRPGPARFREPKSVRYPSFEEAGGNRRKIPAFVFMPDKAVPRPVPVIITIHGGPESQYRPRFSPQIQYWLNELGVAVIAPNVRGSSGYGGNYVALDNGVRREDALKDIGALLDWIARRKDLDASRVIVQGGSYGGYMVLAAMIAYPQRLAGGIDIVGISSFVPFLQNTSGYRRQLRRREYGDERQPVMRAFLERISPLGRAAKIKAPLMIVQGQNDPRVPAAQSARMLASARASGVPLWYMLATNEGHGFRKRGNVRALRAAESDFIRFCLARTASGTP